ncbi:MAG: hypothetical protein ACI8WT_004741 [Clostridium sp.]|jgi:uncharacterized protein YfiM (DUF2279 family)
MKKIIILLLLFSSISFAQGEIFASNEFIRSDYQKHFSVSTIVGSAGYLMGLSIHDGDRSRAIWTGGATGISVNIIKELSDIQTTGFDTNDIVWGFAGAIIGSYLMDKLYYPAWEKRRGKKARELEVMKISDLMTDEEKFLTNSKN